MKKTTNVDSRISEYLFSFSFALFYQYRFKQKLSVSLLWFTCLLAAAPLLFVPSFASKLALPLGLIYGIYILVTSTHRRHLGNSVELVALTTTTIVTFWYFYDIENLFVIFPCFVVVLLGIQALNIQRQQQALYVSELKASELESSLLRKNIQPHFILNSLISISQWIEDDPKKSIEFVESLADEFRLFAKIAGQKLIPVSQDIELAQYHLNIMGFRLEKQFTIEVLDDIEGDWLPPGILHTLVENGVSHNKYPEQNVVFKFRRYLNNDYVSFCLFTPLGKNKHNKKSSIGSGTGEKYLKAQLEQAFNRSFNLVSENKDGNWETRITIPIRVYRQVIKQNAMDSVPGAEQ